jgi:hypothetical protein
MTPRSNATTNDNSVKVSLDIASHQEVFAWPMTGLYSLTIS